MKKSNAGLLDVLFTVIISTMVFGLVIPATAAEPIENKALWIRRV